MTEFAAEIDDSFPQAELRRLAGGACVRCGERYSHRDLVASIALGLSQSPRCLECLANGLKKLPDELRRDIIDYVRRRDCFGKAWREAERLDGQFAGNGWPLIDPLSSVEAGNGPSLVADVEWRMSADLSVLDGLAPHTLIRIVVPDGSMVDSVSRLKSCSVEVVSTHGSIIWARKRQ